MPPSAVPPLAETDVPAAFNVSCDDEGVPQRALSDFVVLRGSVHTSICELDEARGPSAKPVRATGKLTAGSETVWVETGDLIEWCIEYGPTPQLWVRSEDVWYSLGKPASEYAKTHDLAQRRFELCARIYILVTTMEPADSTFKAIARFLSLPWSTMRAYKEKDILSERSFILQQAESLNEKPLNDCAFFRELRAKKISSSTTSPTNAGASKPNPQKVTKKKKVPAAAMSGASDALPPKQAGPWIPKTDQLDRIGHERLLKKLEKAVAATMKMKKATPFLRPVNPDTDGCPDYLDRISKPMDYGTIWKRLSSGKYYKDAAAVAVDVRLIRQNCIKYNGEDHLYCKAAAELEKKFEKEARAAEESELKVAQKRMLSPNTSSVKAEKKPRPPDVDPKQESEPAPSGRKPPPAAKPRNKKVQQADAESEGQECIGPAGGSVCGKRARPGSRYCGDECGIAVARKKLKALTQEGMDVNEYIRSCVGKALVGVNPLNR